MTVARITIEYDPESNTPVVVTAPIQHPTMALKMLAAAISQLSEHVKPDLNEDGQQKPERRILTLNPPGGGIQRA